MVAVPERDELGRPGAVLQGDLHAALQGQPTGRAERHPADPLRSDVRQQFRQVEPRERVKALVHVREVLGLLADCFPDLLITVAQVQGPTLRGAIDIRLALRVPNTDSLAVMEHGAAACAAPNHQPFGALLGLLPGER